jgi:cell division GTPase FtsZ
MGVGEDETLGDAIAVTIIATGFDIEQQWNCKHRAKKNNSYFRG